MSLQSVTQLQSIDSRLDVALQRSGDLIRARDHEISDLTIEYVFNLGQKFHVLKEEKSTFEKEVTLRQHRVELLPQLLKEQWVARLEPV